MQNKSLTSMAELKADLTDLEKKKVGDRVTICHELLTNMLVTSEGVQMPSKSRSVPAVPELIRA
jgi:Trp operon repressor